MNAGTSTHARLEDVSVVAQRDIRFLPAHDLQRTSLAASPSNRLKVKAVLHLPRLRQSLHRVPSLRHSQRRVVPKEEVKVRRTRLPPSLPLSLPRSPLRKQEKSPLKMMTLRRRIRMRSMTGMRKRNMSLRRSKWRHWTTDEDAIDTAGPTRTPNSPVAQQGPLSRRVPSEQARNAAAAVMRTNFPNMIAEMNPDWAPLTAHDLLHHSDDSSDSVELLTLQA